MSSAWLQSCKWIVFYALIGTWIYVVLNKTYYIIFKNRIKFKHSSLLKIKWVNQTSNLHSFFHALFLTYYFVCANTWRYSNYTIKIFKEVAAILEEAILEEAISVISHHYTIRIHKQSQIAIPDWQQQSKEKGIPYGYKKF